MNFCVYIIESIELSTYYIGQTSNITDRLERHNNGESISTKSKRPWKLLFTKEFETRSQAVKFERYLKSLKNKKYLNELINSKDVDASRPD
jgi:putative endonuclease